MQYYFSAVTGVLSPTTTASGSEAARVTRARVYVPRASRPHVAWSACLRSTAAAAQRRSNDHDDDDMCIGTYHALQPQTATSPSAAAMTDGAACTYGIRRLLTVDAHTGTRAVLYSSSSSNSNSVVQYISTCVPSRRRIACLHAPSACASASLREVRMYASDLVGNVYMMTMQCDDKDHATAAAADAADKDDDDEGSASTTTRKRARSAGDDGAMVPHTSVTRPTTATVTTTWTLLAPSHSPVPTARVCADGVLSSFAMAHGAAGWSGLVSLAPQQSDDNNNNSSSGCSNMLVSAREHFYDVRVLDVAAAAAAVPSTSMPMSDSAAAAAATVVRSYATTHSPTALLAPAALPQCVLVCEGALATLYDVRCPSAVLTLADLCQCAADESDGNGSKASTSTARDSNSSSSGGGGVVRGRLTSVAGSVRDACATANPHEVALCIDRALCVYDYRKFNRLFTSSNVLKYDIASVTSTSRGRAVVCAGVDAEVRVIALYDKHICNNNSSDNNKDENGNTATLSLAAKGKAAHATTSAAAGAAVRTSGSHKSSSSGGAADEQPVSTFRTRLNSSVCCETNWQGGWVSSVDGHIAVGVSLTSELFTAQ